MAIGLSGAAGQRNITIKNKHILKNASELGKNTHKIIARIIDPPLKKHLRSYTQQNLKKTPGPVVYDIDWTTPKQKRFFFWKFGDNLPTKRTGEIFRGFNIAPNVRQGEIAIENNARHAEFLIGDRQQRFHKNTGWYLLKDHEKPVLDSSVPVVQRAYISEAKRFLFVRNK